MFNEIPSPEKGAEISKEIENNLEVNKEIWAAAAKADANEISGDMPSAEEVFAQFGFSEKNFAEISAMFYEQELSETEQTDPPRFSELKKAFMDKDLYHREGSSLAGPGSYAFALGYLRDPLTMEIFDKTPYPGYFAGLKLSDCGYMEAIKEGNTKAAKKLFAECMKLDCEKLKKEFFEVPSGDHDLKNGETLLAVAAAPGIRDANGDLVWPGSDYHIYIKGDSGQWYYKPGMLPPRRLDNSFRPIEDPERSSRGDYSMFLGYYVIKDESRRYV